MSRIPFASQGPIRYTRGRPDVILSMRHISAGAFGERPVSMDHIFHFTRRPGLVQRSRYKGNHSRRCAPSFFAILTCRCYILGPLTQISVSLISLFERATRERRCQFAAHCRSIVIKVKLEATTVFTFYHKALESRVHSNGMSH